MMSNLGKILLSRLLKYDGLTTRKIISNVQERNDVGTLDSYDMVADSVLEEWMKQVEAVVLRDKPDGWMEEKMMEAAKKVVDSKSGDAK